LDQFDGTVETAFETTGLVCKLSVILPEDTPSIAPDVTRESANLSGIK
jgi:hypothetical protein